MELWRGAFPDPSTSPAHYTKTLYVDGINATAADAEAGSWLGGFSRVVHLRLGSRGLLMFEVSFVPFHGFSPIRSLHVDPNVPPSSQLLHLILSFPLLEDLTVDACLGPVSIGSVSNEPQIVSRPSNSPACTGSLVLSRRAIEPFARQLLSLPGGIHFRKLDLSWSHEGELSLAMALVEECSRTLEYLNSSCVPHRASRSASAPLQIPYLRF